MVLNEEEYDSRDWVDVCGEARYLLKRRSSSSNSRSVVLSRPPVLERTEVVARLRFFLNPDLCMIKEGGGQVGDGC